MSVTVAKILKGFERLSGYAGKKIEFLISKFLF